MAIEALEALCGCCELCLYIGDALAGIGGRSKEDRAQQAAQTSRVVRMAREEKRGVRIVFDKKRVADIEFFEGPHAGKRASELNDMELKRLAHSMRHRTARFAIRRYLRHRKAGRVPAPDDAVIKR